MNEAERAASVEAERVALDQCAKNVEAATAQARNCMERVEQHFTKAIANAETSQNFAERKAGEAREEATKFNAIAHEADAAANAARVAASTISLAMSAWKASISAAEEAAHARGFAEGRAATQRWCEKQKR